MNPSSGASSNEPIDVSVKGFFNKKITFKTDPLNSVSFKVYNYFEALFKNDSYMIDYKTRDGKIYHLDRHQVELFLDNSRLDETENLSLRIVQQMKKDHPIIHEIKDMQRIFQTNGHSFKTKSGHVIRIYENRGAVYEDYRLKQKITPKLTLQGEWMDDRILVNQSDYTEWLKDVVKRLDEDIGIIETYPKKIDVYSIIYDDGSFSQLKKVIYGSNSTDDSQNLMKLLGEVNNLYKIKADTLQAQQKAKEEAEKAYARYKQEEKARAESERTQNAYVPLTNDQMRNNAFNLLGLKNDASRADILKAFKKLTLQYHPDKTDRIKDESDIEFAKRQKNNEEKFKLISNAYHYLTDPQI